MIVDIVVVLLAIAYGIGGYRNGALVGVFGLVGLVAGAYGGAKLAPVIATHVGSDTARFVVSLLSVLVVAILGQALLSRIGVRLKGKIHIGVLRRVDALVGAVLGIVAVLLVSWAVAVPLANSTIPEVASQVRQSKIIRAVDGVVPTPVQDTYRSLRSVIDRSGFPSVFGDLGPSRVTDVAPPDAALTGSAVVGRVRGSVVKINGEAPSCSRALEGSGFVFAAGRVMTNAHVVAGTERLTVTVPGQGTLAARVVLYDPESDVAVLAVPGLAATPLAFAPGDATSGQNALVLGYPENGPFDVRAARVRETLRATGRDIYDARTVTRSVQSIRALVRPGNSGGPLIDTDGRVLGVVFATAVDASDTGFALTDRQVAADARAGTTATRAVSTQDCTAG